MTLSNATKRVIDTLRDPSSSETDGRAAVQSLFDVVEGSSEADANAALTALAPHLLLDDLERAAFLAMVCGALVEHGCDPAPLSQPLNQQLKSLLEASARLAEACSARMPEVADEAEAEDDEFDEDDVDDDSEVEADDDDEYDDDGDEDGDASEAFDRIREDVAREMPRESAAWEALDGFWRLGIAVYSVSPEARSAARGLLDRAASIAPHNEGAHWLRLMLSVLDNEPVLVIEPETQSGIRGRISGIVDNFQLNVLLMDAFPRSGMLSRRRVSKRVADVARGEGPQQTEDNVTGTWNLYSWTAIGAGLQLPDPNDYSERDSWIWNEGMPADIPIFEGHRVILLGPPSYPRSWQSHRLFDKLTAALDIDGQLSKAEVTDWLERMLATKSSVTT